MCVILHEAANTCQTGESARGFITMDDTKLRHPDRQLLVTAVPGIKDQSVARTVHRLECPLLLLDVQSEHVVLVVLPMTRSLPKFAVVHIWRDDCGSSEEFKMERK
jgi:hypothetical protein